MKTKKLISLLYLLVFFTFLQGSNVQVNNVSLAEVDEIKSQAMIRFDISWNHSWRNDDISGNWDAVWVILKYRLNGGFYQHATLSSENIDHLSISGLEIDAVEDGKGVFIYRSDNGFGGIDASGMQVCWNFGEDGVSVTENNIEIAVLGIEMVYVPEGPFYVGSGGTERSTLHAGTNASTPFLVNGDHALRLGNDNDTSLWATGDWDHPANGTLLSEEFPNGYRGFYCMKYEITQGQYVDFLNMILPTHVINRFPDFYEENRFTIVGIYPDIITLTPNRACNWLNWADGAAYCDWTGLRPMTELEYEKACRGSSPAEMNEYAWGNNLVSATPYVLENDGQADARIADKYSKSKGNSLYAGTDGDLDGPVRVGIFSDHVDNDGRMACGATYYGIMDMSGNLWEQTVTVGNIPGRSYKGINGDGFLDYQGNGNIPFCPGTTAEGTGFRGGSFENSWEELRISDRINATNVISYRSAPHGFRGVRCP